MVMSDKFEINNPFVSIVMPNYNGTRFIEKAIQSVLDQTYENWELIIVDDCSTDDSVSLIEQIEKNDNRIHLIRCEKNGGVAKARNKGIQEAKGKYIALLDSDDFWESGKLEKQLKIAETGTDIVYCSYDFIDEHDKKIKKPFIVPEKTSFQAMLASSVISCSTALIKADLLKTHPFKLNYYHEDYALWMELLKLHVTAKGERTVLAHYRQVAGSRSNKKWHAAKERWNIYRELLGLNIFQSVSAFVKYAINGLIKYYVK